MHRLVFPMAVVALAVAQTCVPDAAGNSICVTVQAGEGECGRTDGAGIGLRRTYPIACNDLRVEKSDARGQVLFSLVLGGGSQETLHTLTVTPEGDTIVTGNTYSANFPTTQSAHQRTYAGPAPPPPIQGQRMLSDGGDLFITRLDPEGRIADSTFLGSVGNDLWNGLAWRNDSSFDALVTKGGPDFPTADPLPPDDGFLLIRFDAGQSKLERTTFLLPRRGYPIGRLQPDGQVLITEVDQALTFDTDGALRASISLARFRLPSTPQGRLDADGNLWFIEPRRSTLTPSYTSAYSSNIARKLTPSGEVLVERTFPAAVVFGESEFEFDSAGRVLFRVYADPGFETTPNAMLSKPCGTNAGLLVLTPTGEIAMVTYLRSGILSFASLRDLDYSLRPKLGCVVAPVGPESIGILPGFALGDTVSLQGNFGTLLNRVTIGGQPASILSQGPGTATVAIPYEVAPGPQVDLVAETAGRPMPAFPIAIRALNPRWVPPAYNVNGTENSPTNPANWGTTIELRFRGLGPYQPSLPAGDLTPAGTTARLQAPVSFSVPGPNGGAPWFPATIEYAGPVPGLLPGLTAVRIRTPAFQFFSGSLFQPAYTGTFTILGNNIPVFLGLR